MLIELGVQCDLVDAAADLAGYRLVVVPDGTVMDGALRSKLDAFVDAGGALIFSGTAALDKETGEFQLVCTPVR